MTKPTIPERAIGPVRSASVGGSSPSAAVQILLVGNSDRPEMAWAIPPVTRGPAGATFKCDKTAGGNGSRLASVCWQHAADFQAAIGLIDAGAPIPDVVVLVQPYPGCLAQDDIEDFRRRYPLTRLVSLAGAWCEGESRSGRPLNGVLRIPWIQWPLQYSRQLAAFADQTPGAWTLPPTATQDERLLARSVRPRRPLSGAVGVASIEQARSLIAHHQAENPPHTDSAVSRVLRWIATDASPATAPEAYCMLRDACAARGAASVFLRGELANTPEARATVEEAEDAEAAVLGHRSRFLPPLRAVVADVASLDRQARSLVAHLAATAAPAPLLLLANFPRIDQAAAAVATGASAVLAKPFDLDDLIAWVERFGCETPSDSGRQQPSHPDEKHRS